MIRLKVNGKNQQFNGDPEMPLLWVLRDKLGMTGTKYGCGISVCHACTVLLDGAPIKSCDLKASEVKGRKIKTIEGLSPDRSHPVQQAWIEEQVPQCGFCQNGQMLTAISLLNKNPRPTDAQIRQGMQGTLCRCMTYYRIQAAIKRAAAAMRRAAAPEGGEVVA